MQLIDFNPNSKTPKKKFSKNKRNEKERQRSDDQVTTVGLLEPIGKRQVSNPRSSPGRYGSLILYIFLYNEIAHDGQLDM